GGLAREHDRHQLRGRAVIQGQRDRRPHARRARQGEARWPVHGSTSVVEEGVRHAQARRQHRVLRRRLTMAIRFYKPTSPGRRGMSTQDFGEITKHEPEKSLLEHKVQKVGRNNYGRITSRFRSGGHKKRYRKIDFKRTKTGVPAKVVGIEYDPNRSARIALLQYADGERAYILAPAKLEVGHEVIAARSADIKPGNCLPLATIPTGTD